MFRPLSETKFINDANLVSYWKLDETSGTIAVDSKGSNNGTWTNFAYGAGKYGNAGSFNGSTSKVDFGNVSAFNFGTGTSFTISMICKFNTVSGNQGLFCKIDGAETNGFTLYRSGLYLHYFEVSGGAYFLATGTSAIFSTGIYYHVVLVRNASGTITRYINGVPYGTISSGTAKNINNTYTAQMGTLHNNAEYLDGLIDDVSIFNRALSSTEVLELYEGINYGELVATPNTKLLLHLNGNSTDSSGNGNNGTDTNITYVNGVFGQGASFNGSSSKISTTTAIAMPTDLTVSCWVKHTNTTSYQAYVGDGNATASSIWYFGQESGKLKFYWGASPGNYRDYITTNVVISTNMSHVAVTQIGTNAPVFYINGTQVSSSLFDSGGVATKPTAQGTSIGILGLYNGFYFNGLIDEVIIENRAWSSTEVSNYHNQSKGVYAPKVT